MFTYKNISRNIHLEIPPEIQSAAPVLPVRIAIVGCGAIAEHGYLPAANESDSATIQVLVDRDLPRATALADRWGIPEVATDYSGLLGSVDAVIVAAPNHLHAPITIDLLKQGIPVLVEKPMALSVAECDRMLDAACEGNARLAVGFVCRFSHAARLARTLIDCGVIGSVKSFRAENGCVFSWPLASDYLFHRETAGGGVLMDLGPHLLDLLMWWLGPVVKLNHFDDGYGGVEAESMTHLAFESGCRGTVRLSRTCKLAQSIVLEGEKATLHVALDRPSLQLRFHDPSRHLDEGSFLITRENAGTQEFVDMLRMQLDCWVHALANGETPDADGYAGRRAAAVIEKCYAERQAWQLPWMDA
jgi:predicted dehydrogenase